jgi:hypothetical protein
VLRPQGPQPWARSPVTALSSPNTISTQPTTMFGVGALLSTVGFVLAGIGTLHARRWSGWARWVPLGIGLFGVVLMFLQFTLLLPAAVGMYHAGFIALGLALARQR